MNGSKMLLAAAAAASVSLVLQVPAQNRADRFRSRGTPTPEDPSVVDTQTPAGRRFTEAPTGFDSLTNGYLVQGPDFDTLEEDTVVPFRSFNDDRFIFEEVESRKDGLGPVYNAQSCRECHQNVATGGASQVAEHRTGRLEGGVFFESLGGSLIHSRATDPRIVERVSPADRVRTFRISTNTLGAGFVEAIPNTAILAVRNAQPGAMRGTVVQAPVLEANGQVRIGRFGWKAQHASLVSFSASGRLPLRPKGVNPDLPVKGDGRYEWTGYLANAAHPHVINPASGYIVNWNNKPAKDFPASDSRWNEQSLQRQKLLTGELARRPKQTISTVLAAANAAATEDVRIVELWPTLKKMLDRGKAPNAATKQVAALLQAWHDAGGSRRDADHDGKIDDPGVPILDAAWKGLTDAGLCDRLGTALCRQLEGRNARFDQPPGGQYGGWHQYMWKDLRALLGQKVAGAYHLRYCGDGSVKTCSRELWAALDAARKRLAAQQGADPKAWRAPEAKEQITFAPIPLITMQYTNKPTGIHQVMQFGP